jgi:hypothetical protein
MKWVTPMAALVLMAGVGARALADDAAAPKANGKATVTVTVVDGDGKPVSGAEVSLLPAPTKKPKEAASSQPDAAPRARPTPLETGTTAADGTFALTKVPSGDFVVAARVKGVGQGREKVTITDDKDTTVSVTLKPRKAKGT